MKVLGFHVISETPISLQGVWIVMLDNHFYNICHLPEHPWKHVSYKNYLAFF